VTIKYKTHPKDQTSLLKSGSYLLRISGEAKLTESSLTNTLYWNYSFEDSIPDPRSIIWARYFYPSNSSTKIFRCLMSEWIIPNLWIKSIPSTICLNISNRGFFLSFNFSFYRGPLLTKVFKSFPFTKLKRSLTIPNFFSFSL
jgi:hypothetical protein